MARAKRRDLLDIKLKCNRCGFKWNPYVPDPVVCPRCKSYYWKVDTIINRGRPKANSKGVL